METKENTKKTRNISEEMQNEVREIIKMSNIYQIYFDLFYKVQNIRETALKNGVKQLSQEFEKKIVKKSESFRQGATAICRTNALHLKGKEREDFIEAFWYWFDREAKRGQEDGVKRAKSENKIK